MAVERVVVRDESARPIGLAGAALGGDPDLGLLLAEALVQGLTPSLLEGRLAEAVLPRVVRRRVALVEEVVDAPVDQ